MVHAANKRTDQNNLEEDVIIFGRSVACCCLHGLHRWLCTRLNLRDLIKKHAEAVNGSLGAATGKSELHHKIQSPINAVAH